MKVAEDKGNEMKMQTKESEKEGYKTKRERGKTFKEIKNNGEKIIIMIVYIFFLKRLMSGVFWKLISCKAGV